VAPDRVVDALDDLLAAGHVGGLRQRGIGAIQPIGAGGGCKVPRGAAAKLAPHRPAFAGNLPHALADLRPRASVAGIGRPLAANLRQRARDNAADAHDAPTHRPPTGEAMTSPSTGAAPQVPEPAVAAAAAARPAQGSRGAIGPGPWPWRCIGRAIAVAGLLLPALAAAQLPVAVPAASPASAASPPTATDWAARLVEARADHARLLAEGDDGYALAERRAESARLLSMLAARVDAGSAPAPAAPETLPPPAALDGPPPYPVPSVDALRDQRDNLLAQQTALVAALKSIEAEVVAAAQARRKADEALRLRQERHERGQDSEQAPRLAGELDLARLKARVAELDLAQADSARETARERLARLGEPLKAVEREIERVRRQQRLDDDDLAKVRAGIESQVARTGAEQERAAAELARRQRRIQGQGEAAARELQARRGEVAALGELQAIERNEADIWAFRQQVIAAAGDAPQRRGMAAALERSIEQVQAYRRGAAEQAELLRSEQRLQRARLAAQDGDAAGGGADGDALAALQRQIAVHDRILERLARSAVLLERSRDDLGVAEAPTDVRGWFDRARAGAADLLRRIWEFEIFSATETSRVDGRAVNVEYGVTVGKSLGALLLFGLGYWLAASLGKRLRWLMVARMGVSPQVARVLHRWLMWLLALVVLLVVLRLARIPLTAFAFLGGALAIGVGFGAQNVIKNLISGAIILFERKVRVGDIVTIGGVSGTVTAVDLRATTVRGFDGVETLVPNSNLLENQVSNWSSGNPVVRRSLVVGVAYGSDPRRTSALMLDCAQRHAAVLADPAAEVLFDDFGADALMFRLQYWLRLDGPRPGPGIDSDLRFAIELALRDAGIEIAFPQRDVHLDTRAPLRVEIARAAPAARDGTAAD
jgi:small-conductance mechanosensitive channel